MPKRTWMMFGALLFLCASQHSNTQHQASREPLAMDLRSLGEKLPPPRKCGFRPGRIFNYCYSRKLLASTGTSGNRPASA